MKSIFKMIPPIVSVMLLSIVSSVTASTQQNNEASRILQAMKTGAFPMSGSSRASWTMAV